MGKRQLQDVFLGALCEERVPVSIYLLNGVRLQGEIEAFDPFVVRLKGTMNQLVYKSAISTIVPTHGVDRPTGEEGAQPESLRSTGS